MTRAARILRIFICCLSLELACAAAQAASAHGRLLHANNAPAAGVTVTLSNEHGRSAPVQSDGKGNYTLANIPAGRYNLEIWVNPSSPRSYPVMITEPDTSLPPEKIP